MELYFAVGNHAKTKKRHNEFILVDKYNIIFEDMIDNLFSDALPPKLKKLKNHDDGKIVDHLFEYDGLFDSEESIFYIGDSKYYKTGAKIGTNSKYKQFTYAKNVIQYNIDILNSGRQVNENIRYRDELTEGYNVSPNFFIQGIISKDMSYKNAELIFLDKEPEKLSHFENRLFDRDTLIVHYYSINFLYVLKAYSQHNSLEIELFKKKSRQEFKKTLLGYLNENYDFYYRDFNNSIEEFVENNFRLYHGQMYRRKSDMSRLIVASEKDRVFMIEDFIKFDLD